MGELAVHDPIFARRAPAVQASNRSGGSDECAPTAFSRRHKSVAVAWLVGAIELLQVLAAKLALHGGVWSLLESLDLGRLGYVVVGLFAATWLCSLTLWKTRRIEQRWSALL